MNCCGLFKPGDSKPCPSTVRVKAQVLAEHAAGERQLSAIRGWSFDMLAIVLFANDYTVHREIGRASCRERV